MQLLERGYTAKKRPSGHDISDKFGRNNRAAIPPNLIAVANTDSNSYYLRYCKEKGIAPHPARYPAEIPEFFVRMLTNTGDLVVDPFAGSCVTGEVCERIGREWVCIDTEEEYLRGGRSRFHKRSRNGARPTAGRGSANGNGTYYRIPRPGFLWDDSAESPLPPDGGAKRPSPKNAAVRKRGRRSNE